MGTDFDKYKVYADTETNDLIRYFANNKNRSVDKWLHYFSIYDEHFRKYRNKKVNILEIGVWHGGSLQMWKEYFGKEATIYGLDVDPECKKLEEERIKIFIGDQGDRKFLSQLRQEVPKFDVIIDDGGHYVKQQITSFEELYPHMTSNGTYLCEDLHTNYWKEFGGGYKRKGTFVEYAKDLVDKLNAYHSHSAKKLKVDAFTDSTYSVAFYDSIAVITRGRRLKPPVHMATGTRPLKTRIFNAKHLIKTMLGAGK